MAAIVASSVPRLEQQSLQRCGVHAVNNLLQQPAQKFTVNDFEGIADSLEPPSCCSWIFGTHHKASCQRGNYDLNVIQVALHNGGFDTTWLKGSDIATSLLQPSAESDTRGFLLNRPEVACCGLWKSNHWYALTLRNERWYLMDSRAAAAEEVGLTAAAAHLETLLDSGGHALRVQAVSTSASSST